MLIVIQTSETSRAKTLNCDAWTERYIFTVFLADCTIETEELYKIHKHAIAGAVYEVQMKLVRNKSLHKPLSHAEML